jgi:hypothetical protein
MKILIIAVTIFVCIQPQSFDASAAAPTCVAKLKFSSNNSSDDSSYVRQVLTGLGYKVINDSLFTYFDKYDYAVRVTINHVELPNFGFPVDSEGMDLYVADNSGNVLVDTPLSALANFQDELQTNLKSFIPPCRQSNGSIICKAIKATKTLSGTRCENSRWRKTRLATAVRLKPRNPARAFFRRS